MKSYVENKLKFNLRQNYDSLVNQLNEQNKKLKRKPGLTAGVILLLIPFLSKTDTGYDREIFWFFILASIASFFYLKYKCKKDIAFNDLYISNWGKEKEIQTLYADYLYEIEAEHEKNSNENFILRYEKVIGTQNQVGLGKSS
jgi:hypothetical protein